MPHFFMLENSSSDEEIRRTQQEVLAIRTYLTRHLATTRPVEHREVLKDPANKMPRPPRMGRTRRRRRWPAAGSLHRLRRPGGDPTGIADDRAGVGCIGCHTNLNEVGQRWITDDLSSRARSINGLSDVRKALSRTQSRRQQLDRGHQALRRDELQRAARLRDGAFPRADGPHLGGIHAEVPRRHPQAHLPAPWPGAQRIGTKLTSRRTQARSRRQWLYSWLIDPRHYSANTGDAALRLTPRRRWI